MQRIKWAVIPLLFQDLVFFQSLNTAVKPQYDGRSSPRGMTAGSRKYCVLNLIGYIGIYLLFWFQPIFAKSFEIERLESAPTFEAFTVCSNHGCRKITTIHSFNQEWEVVRALFRRHKIKTPAEERRSISEAIGLMESLAGRLVGTLGDGGGNSLFTTEGRTDCVDESMNTSHYIQMMIQDQLVQFHKVIERSYRFFPHWTAVIEEKATGQKYSVDSWFYDNGVPPVIYPLEVWLSGQSTQKGDYISPLGIDWNILGSTAYLDVTFQETSEAVEHD